MRRTAATRHRRHLRPAAWARAPSGRTSVLPPIRHLAADLGLARGTVHKVYDALAREGLVESAGRHGTIVLDGADVRTTAGDLAAAADTLAVVVRQLGLDPGAAHRAVDEALARL